MYNLNGLIEKGEQTTIQNRIDKLGDTVTGLQELITYGIKGLSAYVDHAQILGKEDDAVYTFIHESLDYLTTGPADADKLLARALDCGKINLRDGITGPGQH